MKRKVFKVLGVAAIAFIMACLVLIIFLYLLDKDSKEYIAQLEENNKTIQEEQDRNKGTKENPYTLEDTIVITCYAWEGNRILGGTVIGSNTFELSNFRIETGNLSSFNNAENIKVLVFDKKCIETCYENGINWLDTGDIFIDNFFNDNMQSIDYTNISEEYTKKERNNIVYYEGTTYSEAYAMCKIENFNIINSDEIYSLMRILCYDENLDEQYVYVKID
ncbi:hypothetical protein C808_01837 [Lachnospiraceae bacterium M18-1]|nr:hypothetical protein C808_01837 [Lachnospiraceae bacterium M18-1]